MYVAPERVREATAQWLARILELLQATRRDASSLQLLELFKAPELLLAQTCGYPLMTQLRGRVQLIGRPRYELPGSSTGEHCSVIVSRESAPRRVLSGFKNSRGVINDLPIWLVIRQPRWQGCVL